MGLENAHRFARLDEQCLVVLQLLQRGNDGFEAFPVSRGLASPTVNDQLLGLLGYIRVQVVHQHAHGRFLSPAFATEMGPSWSLHRLSHDRTSSPLALVAIIAQAVSCCHVSVCPCTGKSVQ